MADADRGLGMERAITRRDFLHGVGAGVAAWLLPEGVRAEAAAGALPAAAVGPGSYPPVRTGLRGSHLGSFEVAHALAWEGRRWEAPVDRTDERYDLVVVGAGISGLAAARLYREAAGPAARILILDNHDDFGGHAKRNEFHQAGPRRLAWGGSVNLEYTHFSRDARALVESLGVDIGKLREGLQFEFGALGELRERVYFDAEHYGRDTLTTWPEAGDLGQPQALARWGETLPLSAAARRSLVRFLARDEDLLAGMDAAARRDYLRHTSYLEFVTKRGGLTAEAAGILAQWPHGIWGVGIDALPAQECLALGMPGAHAIGPTGQGIEDESSWTFAMFPDGNASLARLLVRSLIPGVAPGTTMEDVVGAPFDYGRLDAPGSRVRLRLESTAVAAANDDGGVAVTYVRAGRAERVRARDCVLACYHAMLPYLCPDLPPEQVQAIRYPVKVPLLVSNVLLADARPFERLGLGGAYAPGRLHANAFLVGGVSLGGAPWRWQPEAPAVVQLYGALAAPEAGPVARDQHRAGRRRLYQTSFEDLEREIRIHLAGLLGAGGFDPARDVRAITVNRWPHGYAYEYNSLSDPDFEPGRAPHELARRRHGRIAIANSDAEAHAYVDGAIDAARRAVDELAALGSSA